MTSVISLLLVIAVTLLAVTEAFPSEKLPLGGPVQAAPSPLHPQGPKGIVPRPQRSAASSKDLSPAESYGFGYGWGYGGFGGPYGYWGGYPYWGGYGAYPYGGLYGGLYGGYYGGYYPYGYDWWWW